MEHKAYKCIVNHSDTAILFIHGIIGTPDHFDPFIPLVPDTISIYNLLLDGHGRSPADFSKSSMRKWETQVSLAVRELATTHDKIYIVAHSMGTLLAIEQAIRHPVIHGLFLLAVPIQIFPKPLMFSNAFKVYTGWIRHDDRHGNAAKAACSIKQEKNPLLYLGWIGRYMELFSKIKEIRNILPQLQTPGMVFQSSHDEMVSANAVSYLKNHSTLDVKVLKCSYHYLYDPEDLQTILQAFVSFITEK